METALVKCGMSYVQQLFSFTNLSIDSPQSLKTDHRSSDNSQLFLTLFDKIFCTIGANVASKFVNNKSNSFVKHLKNRISPSIYFDTPNLTEIHRAIHSLSLNKAFSYSNTVSLPSFHAPRLPSLLLIFICSSNSVITTMYFLKIV